MGVYLCTCGQCVHECVLTYMSEHDTSNLQFIMHAPYIIMD